MKTLSLTPYPGVVYVCETLKELRTTLKKMTGRKLDSDGVSGKTFKLVWEGEVRYLIWGSKPSSVIHELTHCVLYTFDHIGSDPRECNGEPFCYLLDRLIEEAGITCT